MSILGHEDLWIPHPRWLFYMHTLSCASTPTRASQKVLMNIPIYQVYALTKHTHILQINFTTGSPIFVDGLYELPKNMYLPIISLSRVQMCGMMSTIVLHNYEVRLLHSFTNHMWGPFIEQRRNENAMQRYGGYIKRWGDAPIHCRTLTMFAELSEVRWDYKPILILVVTASTAQKIKIEVEVFLSCAALLLSLYLHFISSMQQSQN